jgi:hypothetical protein
MRKTQKIEFFKKIIYINWMIFCFSIIDIYFGHHKKIALKH